MAGLADGTRGTASNPAGSFHEVASKAASSKSGPSGPFARIALRVSCSRSRRASERVARDLARLDAIAARHRQAASRAASGLGIPAGGQQREEVATGAGSAPLRARMRSDRPRQDRDQGRRRFQVGRFNGGRRTGPACLSSSGWRFCQAMCGISASSPQCASTSTSRAIGSSPSTFREAMATWSWTAGRGVGGQLRDRLANRADRPSACSPRHGRPRRGRRGRRGRGAPCGRPASSGPAPTRAQRACIRALRGSFAIEGDRPSASRRVGGTLPLGEEALGDVAEVDVRAAEAGDQLVVSLPSRGRTSGRGGCPCSGRGRAGP